MNVSQLSQLKSGRVGAGASLALAFLVAGCKGLPTHQEREARAELASQAAAYRPGGSRPALPVLTAESSLSNFLAYAFLNQPRVEAAYYDWAASVERITTARSLPDPQITFQADIADIVTSVMPGLMMNFPGPGKLRAGANVASAESQARYFAFRGSILESAFAVKRTYYQLHFLDQRIRVNRETLQLVSGLETLARAQAEVGKVTLQDVLRAEIERERVRTEIANLEDSRLALLALWRADLGIPPEAAAPPVPATFESTPLDLTGDALLSSALSNSFRLRGAEAEVRQAEAAIALARKASMPDSSLGLMADAKMAPVLYRPLATITLPIWRDKIAAQIAEAQANKRAGDARLSAEQIAVAVAVAEKAYLYREATRNLALLQRELLPRQRQSLEVARSGYLSGQIDFFNLTDAEQNLLRFRLDEVEASVQRELSLSELSLLVEGMPPASNAPMASSPRTSGKSAAPRGGSGPGQMNRMN
jgi:outer membrane protein, heavy metal efflux system